MSLLTQEKNVVPLTKNPSNILRDEFVILLDMDGVIANFNYSFNKLYQEITGVRLANPWPSYYYINNLGNKAAVNEVWSRPELFLNAPLYSGAKSFVQALCKLGKVFLITSPGKNTGFHGYMKWLWVQQHFPRLFDFKTFVTCSTKELVRGDFLIEDRVSTVKKWLAINSPEGQAALVLRGSNKKEIPQLREYCVRNGHEGLTICKRYSDILQVVEVASTRKKFRLQKMGVNNVQKTIG